VNLNELYNSLKTASDNLEALGSTDPARFDLQIQVAQLRKEIAAETFDVDADIQAVTVADLSKLRADAAAVAAATSAEQVAPGTVGKIAGIGKLVLRSLGIGLL
jgi:hypothetical protein